MPAAIIPTPALSSRDLAAVARVEALWAALHLQVGRPSRWERPMRRELEARSAQASNAIEGIRVSVEDALAAGEGREMEAPDGDALAVQGYRRAMTFALVPFERFDAGRLLSLHFMMTEAVPSAWPGRWRESGIAITDGEGGIRYQGPPAPRVGALIEALVKRLNDPHDTTPQVVRAAMAHLNLVAIHPFRDGNGRMSRCLQTMVLARAGVVAPAFASIEEYLGRHTQDYYRALAAASGPQWNPSVDASSWVRFCLTAHYVQAQSVARDAAEAARLWPTIEELRSAAGLDERLDSILFDAARGLQVTNAAYRAAVPGLSANLASRDLAAAVKAGLLTTQGRNKAARYSAAPTLATPWQAIRRKRKPLGAADLFDDA
ncbi:MAG: Fic family protein [Sporichthyaceae bacterium]